MCISQKDFVYDKKWYNDNIALWFNTWLARYNIPMIFDVFVSKYFMWDFQFKFSSINTPKKLKNSNSFYNDISQMK